VDFSDKYYFTPSTVVIKNSIPYTGDASLKGKKLGVLKGSTQEKYANGELKKVGAIITPYEAQDQVYLDIKAGRLDGTVADIIEVTGGFLGKPEGKDYKAVGPQLYTPQYFGTGVGVALRKGDKALKEEFNVAIKAIRADGSYKKLNDKYFKMDVYGSN
jgi:arginine/ornithine transport system substrate-binding protein